MNYANTRIIDLMRYVSLLLIASSLYAAEVPVEGLFRSATKVPGIHLGENVSIEAVERIASLKNIESVSVEKTNVTTALALAIAAVKDIRRLELTDCGHLDDAVLDIISRMPNLEALDLGGSTIGIGGADHLKKNSRLRVLKMKRQKSGFDLLLTRLPDNFGPDGVHRRPPAELSPAAGSVICATTASPF